MSPYQFLKQVQQIPPVGGDGFRVVRPLNLPADIRVTADGTTLTAASVPAVALLETNALAVVSAATGTSLGSFVFSVPEDYDSIADELKINILANSGGNSDAPILDAQVYRKRAATALSADLNPTASAAIAKSASPEDDAAWRVIDVSGKSLQAGDVLTIVLLTGAHATDAVNVYGIEVQYKSTLVFSDPNDR